MDTYLRPYFYRLEIDLAVLLYLEEMCQTSTGGSEQEGSSGVSSREENLSLGWERGVIERGPQMLFSSQNSTTWGLTNQHSPQRSSSNCSVLGPKDPRMRNTWPQLQSRELVHVSGIHCHMQLALLLLLLTILQLYRLPPPLPPPVSNSSCLFTQCQPLYASCCAVLLYFSRYCTVRLKMFSLFFVFAFYVLFE